MVTELNAFNIGLDLSGIVLSLTGIIGVIISRKIMKRNWILFVSMFGANIAVMLSNLLGIVFKGDMSPFALRAIPIFNFCEFAFSYTMAFITTLYFIDAVRVHGKQKRALKTVATALYYVALCMLVLSVFVGLYYIIDSHNVYHRQQYYWVSQLFGIMFTALDMIIVILFRANTSKKEKVSLFIYIIIPTAAMVVQIFVYGVYLVLISTTVALTVMLMLMLASYVDSYKQKEQQIVDSKIAILRSQIKPHFLYNSLTAIAQLCDSDPPTAKKATIAFSDYLCGNMSSIDQKDLIPFDAELNHIRTYLYLEQLRFGDDMTVKYDIATTDFRVPALSVQPIVENAVKWGIGEKEDGGTVTLSVKESDTHYIISVTDDGVGFVPDKKRDDRDHIGIENVRESIAAKCGGTLVVNSVINSGTSVIISIPKAV